MQLFGEIREMHECIIISYALSFWYKVQHSRINDSNFFRDSLHGILKSCNMWAQKRNISVTTNVQIHNSWLAAATFDLFLHRVVHLFCLLKQKHSVVFSGKAGNVQDKYLFPFRWVFLSNLF